MFNLNSYHLPPNTAMKNTQTMMLKIVFCIIIEYLEVKTLGPCLIFRKDSILLEVEF